MGQKVIPTSLRLKINETWRSRWFGRGKYSQMLHEDLKIRRYLLQEYRNAAISAITIDRDANEIIVNIKTARPGVIIGKSGAGASQIKEKISRLLSDNKIKINIEEVRNPDTDASIVAQNIVAQLEKRIPFRRAMNQAVEKARQAGAKGIKVQVSGRLNGAEIARSEKVVSGLVPLSTLKSKIDYAYQVAKTIYGTIGVKVWIYKGESTDFMSDLTNKSFLGR